VPIRDADGGGFLGDHESDETRVILGYNLGNQGASEAVLAPHPRLEQ